MIGVSFCSVFSAVLGRKRFYCSSNGLLFEFVFKEREFSRSITLYCLGDVL